MFRLSGLMAGLGLLSLASTATAQPQVTTTPITPPEIQRLNIADVTNEAESDTVRLRWTTSIFGTGAFEYELTYDEPNTEQRSNIPLVEVFNEGAADSDSPEGVAINNRNYQHRMLPSQILAPVGTATVARFEGCPDNVLCLDNRNRNIVVRVYPTSAPLDSLASGTGSFTFLVDTIPPPAPEQNEPLPGESRLTVRWDRLTPTVLTNQGRGSERIQFYEILYCVATSSTAAFPGYTPPTESEPADGDPDHLPCDDPQIFPRIGESVGSIAIEEGLRIGFPTAVAVRAVDQLENRGPLSNVQIATPIVVTDFFELHRELGGEEEGGFCFVATAAHGSYAHPVVRVLRAFRDGVLARSPLGRGVIRAYYEHSPPWARWVAGDDGRRAAARVALLPVALAAAISLALPALGVVLVLAVAWRRRVRARSGPGPASGPGARPGRSRRGLGPLLGLALVVGWPTAARAEQRPDSKLPIGLGFEFKVGPYLPRMGNDDFDNGAFRQAFGEYESSTGTPELSDGPGENPVFNLGSEVQVWRGYGSATIYGSIGFARWVGSGLDQDGLPTADDTTLNIIPFTLQLGYRADFIVKYTPIPLVPYVRGGLGYYMYWVTDARGKLGRVSNPDGDDFVGQGGKFGAVGTAGVALLLNFFDQMSTRSLYNTTSIRGTYLFFEGMVAEVDGFGQTGFDFSDLSWNAGLHLEW